MKKKCLIVIIIAIAIGLVTSYIDSTKYKYLVKNEINKSEEKDVKKAENKDTKSKNEILEQSKEILDCVISKDTEKLKTFFKPSIKNRDKIDKQIEEMLNFIDGKIVSYSDIKSVGGSKSKEYATTVFEDSEIRIDDIKTDTDRTYIITYNIVVIDNENPNDIGVDYIGICDKDLYDSNNGYSYSGSYFIDDEEVNIVETAYSKHFPRKFFDAVLKKDQETLKGFLMQDLQELEKTNMQINNFFEFLDGEIESYSVPKCDIKFDTRTLEGRISNIKTNKGKNYEIEYEYIDGLGVGVIILMDSDTYDKRKGEPISARVYVGDIFYRFNNNL